MDAGAGASGQEREPASLAAELRDLARLAGPVVVSRAGIMTLAVVDTIMVGRYSARELAFQSIASAASGVIFTVLLGLVYGTMVMTARAYGSGRFEACGAVLHRALPYAILLGLVGAAISFAGESILLLAGQQPEIAAGGAAVMRVFGCALPFALVSVAATFFLEGIKRPLPGMVVTLAGNVVNLALNWVLVPGNLGAPALGAVGSAWATAGVRVAMAGVLLAYVWSMADRDRFGLRRFHPARPAEWREQRRIGYGASASIGVETAAFATLAVFAGWLGPLPLAGWSIMLNLVATVFMVALGFAAATGVRVGIAVGRHQRRGVIRAGWLGLGTAGVALLPFMLLFRGAPASLAGLYTGNSGLLAIATPLVAFAAWLLVADGGQVVLANALRGRGDNVVPTLLHLFSYVVVLIPLAWLLAIALGRGVGGLIEAACIASIVSVAVLALRFQRLAGRRIA